MRVWNAELRCRECLVNKASRIMNNEHTHRQPADALHAGMALVTVIGMRWPAIDDIVVRMAALVKDGNGYI